MSYDYTEISPRIEKQPAKKSPRKWLLNGQTLLNELQYCYNCNIKTGNKTTVKPFNLAALTVRDIACKIVLVHVILANSSHTIPTHE